MESWGTAALIAHCFSTINQGTVLILQEKREAGPGGAQYSTGDLVGAGYSADSQQVTTQKCYNAKGSVSKQLSSVKLTTALKFSELETQLGISVSAKGKHDMFAADAKSEYVRSLQDKDYSLSLNYFSLISSQVHEEIAGQGQAALSDSGKSFYGNGNNKFFGIICGDHYISSYHQGALLTMSLNIKFTSSFAKENFNQNDGATFGDIASALTEVKKAVSESKLSGSVTIQAFQMGGEPGQLSKILNQDGSGNFYALTCSLSAMENCVGAASGLLNYAKENFANQFSIEHNKGLTPLGSGFNIHIPIKYIGLDAPPSLVTSEDKQYRRELSNKLKEAEYYQQKMYPLVNNGYPVRLDERIINKAKAILSKADKNVALLRNQNAPKGAVGCYDSPDDCKPIRDDIIPQIYKITGGDLEFLNVIKYRIRHYHYLIYSTGEGFKHSWIIISNIPPFEMRKAFITAVDLTDDRFSFSIDDGRVTYEGKCNDQEVCTGEFCTRLMLGNGMGCHLNYHVYKEKSPFYCEVFSADT